MKIVASEQARADRSRAHARAMHHRRVKQAAAVVKVVVAVSVVHVLQLRCRLILMDCNKGSSRYLVCRSGSTQICKPASTARCFIWKLDGKSPVAVVQAAARRATS